MNIFQVPEIVFEPLYYGVTPPEASTAWAAGLDAKAHLEGRYIVAVDSQGFSYEKSELCDIFVLRPGARVLIPLGFKAALPEGWEVQVRPRSGLAYKHGVTVLNSPGTIDADFTGEWGVLLLNTSSQAYTITHGERIAQLVLAPVYRLNWTEGKVEQRTDRTGGFGSTGK